MPTKPSSDLNRRGFLAAASVAAISAGSQSSARVMPRVSDENFSYEINYTDAEWLERLSNEEFVILREGFTESPKTSPLWEEVADGTYHCRGCDLHTYDAEWKTVLNKGWVFFFHAVPNSIMTDIDGPTPEYGTMADGQEAVSEVHCRRCGSHLGHWLVVEGKMLHCINGTALSFKPAVT